ncbi:MAG: glycoside hydrolase family 13 protein [Anaerolineales bacterium]
MSNSFIPEWAKRVVWYQIFPERFWNGEPVNDPPVTAQQYSWPHDHTSPWQIHPWTSDWYELQPYERLNGRDIWFNIQRRRYGGDLQGIWQRLDYLQELGVTALYLNPVFESPSSHKYDGASYHHIDQHFGPDPEGDRKLMASETFADPRTWVWTSADRLMLDLIAEVHRRGMRIIFDGVFNHLGLSSRAFRDVVENGQASRYKDWFKILDWNTPQRFASFTYSGWFGNPELPELNQDERGLTTAPREYVFAATRRWLDPDRDGDPRDGIDGWRLDVAFCVRHPFWKDWRKWVKGINPEAYLVAEIVNEDVNEPYLQGDEFDAVMHYDFAFACMEFFAERRITVTQFDHELRRTREAYPPGVAYGLQNLLDSHDTNRVASHIVNRGRLNYRNWKTNQPISQASQNPAYDTRAPTTEEKRIQKLMVLVQMTYVGAPMVYYGDEVGMWGANDPCCRKPMVWPELTHALEAVLPDGSPRLAPAVVAFDHHLFDHYRRLIHLRNNSPALQVGEFITLVTDDANGVYAYERRHENERVVVVINADSTLQRVTLRVGGDAVWVDAFDNGMAHITNGGAITVEVAAGSGRVLRIA